jgi:hypothetical protein
MEAAVSSEMVPICQTTWHHMPEDCNLLESNIFNLLFYLYIYEFDLHRESNAKIVPLCLMEAEFGECGKKIFGQVD